MSFSLDFDSLPTLPVIVQQVMTEINNTQSSIKDIASIVERDQSMSAKILKLVNSAFYGFPKRIGTISHAVSILGFETVKSLVLGVAILDAFKIQEFNMFSFWEHSIKTASLSAHFAKKMNYPSPDESFVVGLIHDIGKLIFMMKAPQEYRQILTEHSNTHVSYLLLERKYLKMDHAFAAGQVARLWNFPPAYIQAISGHHLKAALTDTPVSLRQILYVSNCVCHMLAEDRPYEPDANLDPKTLARFKITVEEAQEYLISIEPAIVEFLQIISH